MKARTPKLGGPREFRLWRRSQGRYKSHYWRKRSGRADNAARALLDKPAKRLATTASPYLRRLQAQGRYAGLVIVRDIP